jgi:hypothetical protein
MGGAAGSAQLVNAVTGNTFYNLNLYQSASGGNGGAGYGGGTGAVGGAADSELSYTDSNADSVNVNTYAYGGNGGSHVLEIMQKTGREAGNDATQ